MRRFLAGGIALVIAGVMAAGILPADLRAQGNSDGPPQDGQFSVKFSKILEQLRRKDDGRVYGLGGKKPPACKVVEKNLCTIEVEVIQTYSSGGAPYGCILRVNDVSVETSDAVKTNRTNGINWILTSATSSSSTYSFYPDSEILVVKGTDTQIEKKMVPYPAGSVASSVACAASASAACSVKANYKGKKGDDITYYPVVIQNDGRGNEILCGALDPKIVNN